ncbi:MAG TPA: DUF1810 domain-containing protein [Sphingomicrobium sp.]|nr:DUF1810 domain-containing protein [Sphingomicrobium sp.]
MKRITAGMNDPYNLQRFVDAQDGIFEQALAELRRGRKESHWMWFIFPQLAGLGRSSTARYYALASIDEAGAYLAHPLLGPRLRECAEAILPWSEHVAAEDLLGPIDALKLKSSLTLFDRVEPDRLFRAGLERFFAGERDERTLALLNEQD